MSFTKIVTATLGATVLLLAASCSNNNVRNNDVENDTNVVDTRRYSDTTGNYITGDSAGINQTPASGGTGLDN